jgi:hypothetical protein
MLNKQTLFVVGARAGFEIDMPVGNKLVTARCSLPVFPNIGHPGRLPVCLKRAMNKYGSLFDHLVRAGNQSSQNGDTERLGRGRTWLVVLLEYRQASYRAKSCQQFQLRGGTYLGSLARTTSDLQPGHSAGQFQTSSSSCFCAATVTSHLNLRPEPAPILVLIVPA